MTNAKRDDNRVPGLLGVSSADGTTVLPVKINPATGRVLAEGVGGSGDAIFDVSTGVIVQNVDGGITAYTDDFVLGSPTLNDDGLGTHDAKIGWDVSQGAFLAGWQYSTNWDTASRGYASINLGEDNRTPGAASFAVGYTNQVDVLNGLDSGFASFALGTQNVVGSTNDNTYGSGAFGDSNTVYGYVSMAFGDNNTIGTNVASDVQSAFAMGTSNTVGVNADQSLALGLKAQGKFPGSFTLAYSFTGFSIGSQVTLVTQRKLTTNATPTELTFGGGSPGASNSLILPASTTWGFRIMVTARQTAGAAGTVGDSAVYEFVGGIKRDGSSNTALVGSVTKTVIAEDQAAWDCDVAADDTNESLDITVTGEASKTIAWCATIQLTEAANN